MKETLFLNDPWTILLLDTHGVVVAIEHPDQKLFFGQCPAAGEKLLEVLPQTAPGLSQVARIADAIARAKAENRSVYLEYRSLQGQHEYPVTAYVEPATDGTIRIQARAINAEDLQRARDTEVKAATPRIRPGQIYEHLPIGLEIYDKDGALLEINSREMSIMGVTDKRDVLGLNLFSNPNLSGEILSQLKQGEAVHFTVEYDFDKARNEYYKTTISGKFHIAMAVSVVRDAQGQIDKYLLVSEDITERVLYQQKYETLYNQNMTILNSLPVGVELYSSDGQMLYLNDTDCRIFGVNREEVLSNPVNIDKNPNLPQQVKDAVHNSQTVLARFPYSFKVVADQAYYTSTQESITLQIECSGQPVFNAEGELQNYVFIVRNVTEESYIAEQLRQSKQKTEVAMHDADIMIWEFDVRQRFFLSDNEPLNAYDHAAPISIEQYVASSHIDDQAAIQENATRMLSGEDFAFQFEARVKLPGNPEWQYCTISGSPYERDSQGRVTKFVGSRKNNTNLQRRKILQETILNSIPLSIHIKDVEDNFRYVFCNEESRRMFGSSTDKNTYDIMDEAEVLRIEKTDLEVFTTGTPYLGAERITLKNGQSYDTIARKSIIFDGEKRLLLNVRWDQSLENDLQRRAKVLSLSMQAMNAYTWFFDPEELRVSFGEGFERTGRNPQLVNSLDKFAACVHPDDRQRFIDSMTTVLQQNSGEWCIEYRVALSSDGYYEWWETRGILETTIINDAPYRYMLGMSVNIDAHKQAETVLIKNKEELNSLIRQNEMVLNNTNSGLAYITTDYIVQWENVSICTASLSFEAYKTGQRCYASTHNRTTPCENCVMQRAIESRQMEQIQFSVNGNNIEVFATPVVREDGQIDGVVIRVDDVTERERMIEELRKAKVHAEQSDKLKSAFLANMSHEIRTPLNAIVGFSELLLNTEELEDREEYIQIINNNNELLLKLINDILDLSKIEAGSVELKYEEFDLAEYFDGMAASMQQRVKNPNVRLIATNPYSNCWVQLDKNRIAQILTNYVTNAIKYTPKGFIEMGYEMVTKGIRFFVKDSGIGIAEEKKDKVFHRFEKLDEFAQGTGLGLSICKAITESMGGSVGFESRDGEGSLFWAILPCEPDVRHEKSPDSSPSVIVDTPTVASASTSAAASRKTILIAEDIPSNYLLISALLKKSYNLLHAENGQQAVDLAHENNVDLVLMDMKMPVMDGLTATQEIRKFKPQLPIVALTAHAFDADKQVALSIGCNDYLVKPVEKLKLLATLKKYCRTDLAKS